MGHKREHALKFQSVAIPNGLIAYMFGPVGSAIEQYYFNTVCKNRASIDLTNLMQFFLKDMAKI